MPKLEDWTERPLECHKGEPPLDIVTGTWSVSRNVGNAKPQIEITRENDDGFDQYTWLTEADLQAMLEAVRQTTTRKEPK